MDFDNKSKIPSQDEMAHERTMLSEQRTDMATERTNMAYERTALANSQTLLSFARTAIAIFAGGIGMFEFINNQTIVTIGIVFMAVSPVIMAIGIVNYVQTRKRIRQSVERWLH
ncbi:MAG: DUF202 domain-containing protein [Firmicutes bacterium]|nr:DUF202 domain-containing protein [Bacillota bacterium]